MVRGVVVEGREKEDQLTASYYEEGDVTLAQLSRSPKTKPKPTPPSSSSPSVKQKKPNVEDEKFSKMKKVSARAKINLAASGHSGKVLSSKQNMATINGSCALSGEAKSSAVIRAQEVRSNLGPEYPSFVKSLVRSHVASCFWMGLPGLFCKTHLPDKDVTITLEDESGKQYQSKYIAYKTGLSAGWRQFAAAHNLLEGDVLVFQLVEPTKFKVYIIRPNDLTEVDGALGLLNLDAHICQDDEEMDANTNRKRMKSLPLAVVEKKKKKTGQSTWAPKAAEQSENDSEEVGSEVYEGSKLSRPAVQFKDVKSFENFSILVDGFLIDSELPEDIRQMYYKLCCSQNAFLHEHLIKGINYKLIVGIIYETVNIANAIKSCKLATSWNDFAAWEKSLKAFELLGMNVGFLRARLCRLANLACESEDSVVVKRFIDAETERSQAKSGIRNIERKLEELKEACDTFGVAIENLRSQAEIDELKFQEQVNVPW
ncbi:B3 domain-containing protein Os01g0234100 isoform X2 [Ziziphus jujuba]|uniref:B3 domain-containing protein Os01g0234100 isoform X2 n=1 Tax=Ziziphus jujuba TaxID=326968 RepID=A0A6P4AVJ7_ZIZJJ|nr:B3 domain-containing protein Os01g0234100 isoform X2 [Ziziphus jujuba]